MIQNPTRHLALLVAAVLVLLLTGSGPAHAYQIDDYAGYDPQTRCASKVKPGTEFLLGWLVEQYPKTRRSSTLRSCATGGTSEHKDGRALDWGVDATRKAQRLSARRFLDRIFATDRAGSQHALARRMGIMYIIWNDQMWASYREFEKRDYLSPACRTKRKCSKTLRHRDHVHISLSREGAAALTTFYVNRDVPTGKKRRR